MCIRDSLEKYKSLIDRLIAAGVSDFDISGGEPLLYPYIFEFLAYILNKDSSVTMVTNGTLLTRVENESDISVMKRLTELHVSIDDASAAVHDRYRGRQGAFDKAVRGLTYLRNLGAENLCINTIMFSENCSKACEMLNFAKTIGVRKICLLRLLDLHNSSDQKHSLTEKQIHTLLSDILTWISVNKSSMNDQFTVELTLPGTAYEIVTEQYNLRLHNTFGKVTLDIIFDPFRGCNAFRKNIVISSEGEATGCTCMLGDPKWQVGNVFDLELETIRDRFDIAYQNIKDCKNSVCSGCAHTRVCRGGCPAVPCKTENCVGENS